MIEAMGEEDVWSMRLEKTKVSLGAFRRVFDFDPSFKEDIKIEPDSNLAFFTLRGTSKERLESFRDKAYLFR